MSDILARAAWSWGVGLSLILAGGCSSTSPGWDACDSCANGEETPDEEGVDEPDAGLEDGDGAWDAGSDPEGGDGGSGEDAGDAGSGDAAGDTSPQEDAGIDAGDAEDDAADGGPDETMDAGDGGDEAADGGEDGGTSVPYCRQVCGGPADCAQAYAPWDADNWNCTNGTCAYRGCRSDAECQSVPGMSGYVCHRFDGQTISQCVRGCTQAAGCAQSYAPWDEDNYACTDGACDYLGCNTDAECQSVPNMETYVCRALQDSVPTCQLGCGVQADCSLGTPAFDADNYSCQDGLCVYQGCLSDEECEATITTYPTVCQ